jgi:hypothetical protein
MLIVNALTIAGGTYRTTQSRSVSIGAEGDLRLAIAQRFALMAKELRLKAEAEDLENFPVPSRNFPAAARQHMENERLIFDSHLKDLRDQLHFIGQSTSLRQQEIESLNAQIEAAEKEKQSVQRELDDTRALVARGLSQAPRILPLERTLTQLYSRQKELETLILRSREEINQTEIKRRALLSERRNAALGALQALQIQLKELEEREATARQQILASGSLQFDATATNSDDNKVQLRFAIIRIERGVATEFDASETTRVEPGDIIKVSRQQKTDNAAAKTQDAVR